MLLGEFLLEGQMPVLVALAPPEVLQAAPELMRLLDAANFLAARSFRFGGELEDEPAQRFLQALGQLLVVGAGWRCGLRGRGRAFYGRDRRIRVRNGCLCGHSFLAIEIEVGNEWKN